MKIINYIIRIWNDFWFEWYSVSNPSFGGHHQSWRTFRKQRLFNVIIVLIIIALIIVDLMWLINYKNNLHQNIGNYQISYYL